MSWKKTMCYSNGWLKTTEPEWVPIDLVLTIHRNQIAEHGGTGGLRDKGLLKSALAKPRNLYLYNDLTPSLAEMAAAYAFGIVCNRALRPLHNSNQRKIYGHW